MLATDFFNVETAWLQRLHVLFFMELLSRKVHLASITASPTGEWVAQQARNLAWKLQDRVVKAKFLLEQRRPCEPAEVIPLPTGRVECHDRFGGLLHEYFRAA